MSFILKMAWRDSRRNRARLLLFISAIVAGIAALTAVRSFSVNLTNDIDREAKSLLGADLLIEGNQPLPDSLFNRVMSTPGAQSARVFNLLSMAYFPKTQGTRLTNIRASDPGYPFFGTWKSAPEKAYQNYQQGGGKKALVEHGLLLQFGVGLGDSIQIGTEHFEITGDLLSRPGRAGIGSAIAPVAFIPIQWLDSTNLVQKGSRVWYQYYFKIPQTRDLDSLVSHLDKPLEKANMDWETVESNKRQIGRAFGNFSTFLNLVGFVALLLGCIGVAGAVHIYIKDKLPTVAILRCLGASGRKAFYVYLVQVAGIGLFGAVLGAALGSLIQKLLPWVAKDLLPIADVSTDFSATSALQGVLLGVSVALLFALLPLSGILKTSPLRTLRASFGEQESTNRWLRWGIYALIAASLFGFTWWLIRNLKETLIFMGGIAGAFLLLFGVAKLLMVLLRRFFPKNWSYVWRQGIANLFRPENQTVLLVVTIGLGTMLLSTLFLIQNLLLRQVEFSGSGNQPNMILFDIQTDQKDSVAAMVQAYGMPLLQQVPIVTTRVETIDGLTKMQADADTTEDRRNWVYDREFRVTFRDTLIDTEKIVEGTWTGVHKPGEPIKISISDNVKRGMRAKIGTKVVFNVQGTRLETEVGSVREVDFNRVQTNFLIVFPKGVLEAAPQFHVVVSRVNSAEQSAAFQSALVRRFPTVSAIDLTQILKSVDEVLTKVSFVIRFMALFSILTGLLVLLSSIYQGKFARVRESVLLRTLGASRKVILRIIALEYLLLGALACLAGVGLSVVGAWALAYFSFKIPFEPDWLPLLGTFLVITVITVLIGLANSREVVRKPPLEVLRQEL
ncbi:MAG: FtsX-like permease family protein [Lewinellaceae bacterium]|nr:FtsX-like permease family protein [Saprospiraceae bacterium]MCB9333550.1 FtsX-like permease family protein [Lewinellaceae bacterium]